jgi:hypothetical protein
MTRTTRHDGSEVVRLGPMEKWVGGILTAMLIAAVLRGGSMLSDMRDDVRALVTEMKYANTAIGDHENRIRTLERHSAVDSKAP